MSHFFSVLTRIERGRRLQRPIVTKNLYTNDPHHKKPRTQMRNQLSSCASTASASFKSHALVVASCVCVCVCVHVCVLLCVFVCVCVCRSTGPAFLLLHRILKLACLHPGILARFVPGKPIVKLRQLIVVLVTSMVASATLLWKFWRHSSKGLALDKTALRQKHKEKEST